MALIQAEAQNPLDAAAFLAARDICRAHARSFYFASFFLPRPKRFAAYAVYAFCRMIDDAIDLPTSTPSGTPMDSACGCGSELSQRLEMFRARLDAIYSGQLCPPDIRSDRDNLALHAFAVTVRRLGLPKEHFLDLAEGCRMDLTIRRYATWASLNRYCYHVAGVVGLVMCGVLGTTHSDAGRYAVEMGNAMQLTNILRDVKEDWERGRIYLPLEDLARFRYTDKDLAAGVVNDNFRNLMRFQIERARRMYRSAAEGLCWLANDGSRLTASAMATIYSGILTAIERQGYDVFSRRAALTTGEKFTRLPSAWRLAWRKEGQPVPTVFGGGKARPIGHVSA